jgi:hypothetical protein
VTNSSDRREKNRSKFIAEAVRRELDRRRRVELSPLFSTMLKKATDEDYPSPARAGRFPKRIGL